MNGTSSIWLENVTDAEMWILAAVFYFFLCGVFGTLANGLIVAAIRKNKQLRSRFFLIVSYLSLCRLLLCVNTAEMGVQRMLRMLGLVNVEQRSGVCNLFHVWFMGALTLELMLILFMIVDRMIAIVSPVTYNTMDDAQASQICQALYALTVCKILTGFFLRIAPWDTVICVSVFSGVSELGGNCSRFLDVSLGIAIVLLYAALLVHIRFWVKQKLPFIESQAAKASLERQLRLMPLLRNQVVLHSCLSLASKLLVSSAVLFRSQFARLTNWGGCAVAIDVMANTLVILMGNKEIRKTAFALLRCGNNTRIEIIGCQKQQTGGIQHAMRNINVVVVQ